MIVVNNDFVCEPVGPVCHGGLYIAIPAADTPGRARPPHRIQAAPAVLLPPSNVPQQCAAPSTMPAAARPRPALPRSQSATHHHSELGVAQLGAAVPLYNVFYGFAATYTRLLNLHLTPLPITAC